jgi:hypothetical protein
MSITQVTPTTVALPASTAQGASAPTASSSNPSATKTAATAVSTKPDADGDFDGSKTPNDDAVKVTLSDAAIKTLASNKGGQGA